MPLRVPHGLKGWGGRTRKFAPSSFDPMCSLTAFGISIKGRLSGGASSDKMRSLSLLVATAPSPSMQLHLSTLPQRGCGVFVLIYFLLE